MGGISYVAHVSNGKSAITTKRKLEGVAKHNLRKYKSDEYSAENIIPFFLSHNTFDCTLVCRMAQQASSMVTQSVDAFVRRDVYLARSVAGQDDLVDEDFTAVKQALIAAIAREPGQGEVALDLLMIAKYFERIGDHAVNLSEWVEFSVTGVHKHDGVEYE